ncbi:hypothetical protein, partial [Burkholderia ubonensis]|uniref:hypothetical protein n=1 Tax=Burkholderia ubonensis TaxID=101571 RepID=UPI0039E9EC59
VSGPAMGCPVLSAFDFFAEAEWITDGRTHVQQTATVRNNVHGRTRVTHRKPAVLVSYKRIF